MRSIRMSALPDADDCGRRMFGRNFRYEVERAGYTFKKREGKPYNRLALHGNATHSMFEATLKAMIDGKEPKDQDALEAGIKRLEEEWDQTEAHEDIPTKDTAIKILNVILPTVMTIAHDSTPTHSEHEMRMVKNIDDPVNQRSDDWEFTAHVDRIATVRRRGQNLIKIDDFKTSGGLKATHYHTQIGGYVLLAGEEDLPADLCGVVSIARRKRDTPEPTYDPYNVIEVAKMAEATLNRIVQWYNAFEATGDANVIPANPRSQICGAKYCDFYASDYCCVGLKIE